MRQVQAITSNAMRGFANEDCAAVLLQFDNGALGSLTGSDAVAAPWSWELELRRRTRCTHVKPITAVLFAGRDRRGVEHSAAQALALHAKPTVDGINRWCTTEESFQCR